MAVSRYAATIDPTGISAPDFATVLANLTADYLSIFGSDTIISNDTQDGQWIGINARLVADCNAAAIACYNAYSPATAQGNGLSSNVKINGLKRKIPSSSVVTLTIVGQAGIPIVNGQASDGVFTWVLPALVTIPVSGTIDVQAVCTTLGAVNAAPGTITTRKTPFFGWQTVTNAAAAVAGTPIETDAALRVRQDQSTSLPSQLIFDGIEAGINAVVGVTRERGYENNTGAADGNGLAAHALEFIVEGGANQDIWNVLALKTPPGIPTAGEVSTSVVRPSGSTRLIKFSRGTAATIVATINVKSLTGWSAGYAATIQQAVLNLLLSWTIGGDPDNKLSWSQVALAAAIPGLLGSGTFKIASIQLQKNGGSTVTNTDIALAFNEVVTTATRLPVDIVVNVA